MKKNVLYIALASVSLLLASCNDDWGIDNGQYVPKHPGEEIMFGGSASYDLNTNSASNTRTVYGGYEQGATEEPVYWVEGDAVRIYSPQARFQMSDYDVNVSEGDEKVDVTGLTRRGDYSLQWGAEKEHDFYAVYPAPSTTVAEENLNGVKTINGEIPATQNPSSYVLNKDKYSHVFMPDMKYAYMVARTNIPDYDKIGANVYLKFIPIATAVEVTLVNNSGRNLVFDEITLSSATKDIAGTFTANLEDWTMPTSGDMRYATGYPETESTGTSSTIVIPTKDSNGAAISVQLGESVTFTAFMLPDVSVDDLQIVLKAKLGDKEGYKTGTLKGVNIQMHKKTYLRGLTLSAVSYTQAEWVKAIVATAPTTTLKALSISGAGGAASGNMQQNETTGKYRQQNLTIEQLWDKGIRCFEFAVDVAGTTVDGNTELGKEIVICNGNETGVTLNEAFGQVTTQLKEHPQEFAMIILAYQTLGGFNKRAPATFMTDFNAFWDKFKAEDANKGSYTPAVYSPTMTVKDAQAKLFCIVRPTSIYQDYNDGIGEGVITAENVQNIWNANEIEVSNVAYDDLGITTTPEDIIVVKGWGALKDKWEQRGYNTHSLRQDNRPSKGWSTYTGDGKSGRPFDTSTMKTSAWSSYTTGIPWHDGTWYGNFAKLDYTASDLSEDFEYETTGDLIVYAQEWARVSNLSFSSNDEIPQVGMNNDATECSAIVWNNTYSEKCNNITNTLTKALANTGSTLYINSLCGYFISMNIPESFTPCTLTDWSIKAETVISPWRRYPLPGSSQTSGMYGDIETYAKTINDFFNKHLQTITTTTSQLGSMGIILLDRVGEYESSERIPQIIIANNFQFKLSDEPKLQTVNKVSLSSLEEGDVIAAPQRRNADKDSQFMITWE